MALIDVEINYDTKAGGDQLPAGIEELEPTLDTERHLGDLGPGEVFVLAAVASTEQPDAHAPTSGEASVVAHVTGNTMQRAESLARTAARHRDWAVGEVLALR